MLCSRVVLYFRKLLVYGVIISEKDLFQLKQWLLTGGSAPPGGREPLHAPQHGKFLNRSLSLLNVKPVLILRRYMLFGLVPAEMEVGVKFLEILQAEFESANKHSGPQLRGLFSRHDNSFQ